GGSAQRAIHGSEIGSPRCPSPFRTGVAQCRSLPRGTDLRRVGRDWTARRVLRRHPGRRCVEDDQRRSNVVPCLRFRQERFVHRRRRGGTVGPRRDLRRDGRPELVLGGNGRRDVQVLRCRTDVASHGPRGHTADHRDSGSPARPEPRVGGLTWREIVGGGLPPLRGRVSIAAAIGSNAQRVYLIGDFGLYRSDDGGTSWRQMAADDKRIANAQGGYNSGVYVDPKNADIVYTFHVTAYRSTDGGNSFTGFKGGPPGGDDPQVMWIDPTDGKRMLMGYDQ